MSMKKFKASFISVIISLSLAAGLLVSAVPASALEINEETVLTGLVAYWDFDGDYREMYSYLKTNLGGADLTYTEGVYGKAAVFNGVDNYLYVDPDPALNLGNSYTDNNDNFTISAWVNLGDSKGGQKYLFDKGLNQGGRGNDGFFWSNPYRVFFDSSKLFVDFSNVFNDYNVKPQYYTKGASRTTGKTVDGEEWFLLTVTYDGKIVKVYRDNQILMQSNYTEGITFNNDSLFIGTDCSLKYFFQGAIDDLRMYNKTLSYDDVDSLYKQGLIANKELVEPTKQLVAYYPFDGNLKDESIFKNDAEKIEEDGTTEYMIGKNGKAIAMSDGNYIRVPASPKLNFDNEFTVSFWLKVDADGTYPVLYQQNPSALADNDNDWTYNIYLGTWTKNEGSKMTLRSKVYNPSSWGPTEGSTLASPFSKKDNKVKSNSWFHYAFTYKDGQLKSFLNGKLQKKTDTKDLVNIANASGDLLIGYDNKTFMNGAIDELKIFNSCLSTTDISKEAKRVDSIMLSTGDAQVITEIGKGKTHTISSIVYYDIDANSYKTLTKGYTFKSSDSKIFKVDDKGKITAVKAGEAKLTITYGCHTATYEITVK